VIDETSPLFGLNLHEFPGNSILAFRVTINAFQELTKSPIAATTGYEIQDGFEDQVSFDHGS
jgi:hypothetical protein